jgi:transmembrane sensor
MPNEEINRLIKKYLDGSATSEDREIVLEWYRSHNSGDVVWETGNEEEEEQLRLNMLNNITSQIRPVKNINYFNFYRISAAAIVLFFLSTGLYFLIKRPSPQQPILVKNEPKIHDVDPGINKATLTLANGSKISLNDASTGEVAQQEGIHIIKKGEGQLIYDVSLPSANNNIKILFNTITTPRGGKYQVNLPDGSKVWLNAASSLTYPTVFTGKERKVTLTGEAYFEIAHNKLLPFKVETRNQIVQVYGTHFNINSYDNEPVTKTTLLEGSVQVVPNGAGAAQFLNPGQEASLKNNGALTIAQADTLEAISWKNGDFLFNDASLVDIMRQLERWYDVDVDYGNIPQTRYNGLISRSVKLSEVLQMLELTSRVKFKIEASAIKISKK